MLFWHGTIAKLIEFGAKKLLGKQIDLLTDQKRRACKVFLRLYEHLEILESISEDALKLLRPVAKEGKPLVYYHLWRGMSEKVDHSSKEFLQIIHDLGPVLNLYDPALLKLLGRPVQAKMGFMMIASEAFDPKFMKFALRRHEKGYIDDVSWTQPNSDLSLRVLEAKYATIQAGASSFASLLQARLEWPSDVLLSILSGQLHEDSLRPKDVQQVRALYDLVSDHVSSLRTARTALAEFIKSQFKIDDLLGLSNVA